jgi:DNA-binding transcriptional MerR regulator
MGTREAGMLSVGEVARRSGLTTKALRHYDRLGLLVPAAVSDDGYRWYSEEQVGLAVTIARLRALDVPLDAVRAVLAGAGDDELRRLLTAHRAALQARDDRIRRALHSLDHLLHDSGGASVTLKDTTAQTVSDERGLAAQLFNGTWALLEKESRTPEEDDRMVHMAHASRFHWDNVGDDQHRAIGEWQVARVYAVLGHGESALFHARRCLDYASRPGIDDWLLASAHEGLARAQAVAGDVESARDSRDTALALLDKITDPEDREVVAVDIDTLPIP